MPSTGLDPNQEDTKITRGRIGQLKVYEVSESELTMLEQGSSKRIYLDFSIFLLSVAISFFISVKTTEIKNIQTFVIFIVIISVGATVGSFLLILWWKNRKEINGTFKKIRGRINED